MGRQSQFVALIKRTLDRQQRGLLRTPVIVPIGATRALGEGFFLPHVSGLGALLKEMQSDSLPNDNFTCTPLVTQKDEYLDTYFRNYGFEPGNPNKHYYRTNESVNPGFKADDINTWTCLHVQRSAQYRSNRPNSKANQMYEARSSYGPPTAYATQMPMTMPRQMSVNMAGKTGTKTVTKTVTSKQDTKRMQPRQSMQAMMQGMMRSMNGMTLNSQPTPANTTNAPTVPIASASSGAVDPNQLQLMQFFKEMEIVDKINLEAEIVINNMTYRITDYPNLVFQSRDSARQTELKQKYPALIAIFDKIEPNNFNPFFVQAA